MVSSAADSWNARPSDRLTDPDVTKRREASDKHQREHTVKKQKLPLSDTHPPCSPPQPHPSPPERTHACGRERKRRWSSYARAPRAEQRDRGRRRRREGSRLTASKCCSGCEWGMRAEDGEGRRRRGPLTTTNARPLPPSSPALLEVQRVEGVTRRCVCVCVGGLTCVHP